LTVTARRRSTTGGTPWRTPLPWLAGLLLLYLLVPLVAYVGRLGGATLSSPGLGAALAVSLGTAAASTLIIAVLGVPLGYLLARARGPVAGLAGLLVQLPLALPPLMSGILLVYLVGPYSTLGRLFDGNLTDSLTGVVLAQTFVAAPFLVVAARSAFAAVDPALADVAATLGHGRWSRFARVAVPVAAPGIRAGLLLAFLRSFGEFGATVVLAYHPYTLPVYTYVQFGSTGLDTTMLPVGVALLAALTILALSTWFPPLRRPHHLHLPTPHPPTPRPTRPLTATFTTHLGTFHLDLSVPSTSPPAENPRVNGRGLPAGEPCVDGGVWRLAVLGPSGAGKSMALRALAGLLPVTAGSVRLGDRDVTALPPDRRGIGYLPQDPALIPHLTVAEQVTFGRGADRAVAAYWLERFGLAALAGRRADQLSGGQRRRVALARALAREPDLLLLDEPFAGLDAPVRDDLRWELRRLQRDTGIATVVVTHDPDEAALLADHVVLLSTGRVLQQGPQPSVYARPASPEAARLLGIRNVNTARVSPDGTLTLAGTPVPVDQPPGTEIAWYARPDRITLTTPNGTPPTPTDPLGTVTDVIHLATVTEVVVELDPGTRLTVVTTRLAPDPGTRVALHIPAADLMCWPLSLADADDAALANRP
jgi:ABC-type sulfate/molybdate transport systems ATPase subunit/ABC-type sulfate transport system permease component